MFGYELIVAPVMRKGITKHKVYLQKGHWVSLFDGKEYNGGTFEVDAPLGKPAAFYQKGTRHEELFKTFKEGV